MKRMKAFCASRLTTWTVAICSVSMLTGGCPQPSGSANQDGNNPGHVNPGNNGGNNTSGGSGNTGGNNNPGGNSNPGTIDRSTIARPSTPTLFVTDNIRGLITFANAHAQNGNVTPASFISNRSLVQTGLATLAAVAVDRAGALIVHDVSVPSLVFYDNAGATRNDRDPTRELAGANLPMSPFEPGGIAVDRENDRVFLATGDNVLVFEGADLSRTGNAAPTRTFSSPDLRLDAGQIALGPNGDLYVAHDDDDAVVVFANAASRSGRINADRTIRLADFRPDGLFVDALDRLYVSDFDRVAVVEGAATLDGEIEQFSEMQLEAVRAVDDSGVRQPCIIAIAVDSRGFGYCCDLCNAAIYIVEDFAQRSGLVQPNRAITGGATLIPDPTSIFLWE